MKQFFKFLFASLLGSLVSFVIIFFVLLGIFASVISYAERDAVRVEPNSVLYMSFDKPITDRTANNPFSGFSLSEFKLSTPPGLNDILMNIEKAKSDSRIKGIYLELGILQAGFSTVQEIRSALAKFKESGKFVICYGDYFSQGAYYLGSVADELYINPEGMIMLQGLNAEVLFIKGLLEKLEIEAQVIRSGKYKSAVEMFLREDLSEENRQQIKEYITTVWDQVLMDISTSRNININDLNLYTNNLTLSNADAALKYNFADGIKYKDEILDILRTKLDLQKDTKPKTINLVKYTFVKKETEKKRYTRDRVAVVYAEGEIVTGSGDDQMVGSSRFSKAIRDAREDKNIKAIVLRVNSPGGSLLASEIIRREVELAAKEKPLIVSMGDVAASGGYWISCNADKIYAEQTTLTGSIGVYGIFPNFQDFLNNKLGVTFDNVMTNENADFMSAVKPLNNFQLTKIKNEIDKEYNEFLNLVSESRDLRKTHVDSVAQGKIWSGTDAKRIGLIDEIGGLEDAINEAVKLAGINNYRIMELPELKDPFEQIFQSMFAEAKASYIKKELGVNYKYYQSIRKITEMEGIQARIPYYITLE
jgi:protease-4